MASPVWCPFRFDEFEEGVCLSGCAWNVGGRCAVAILATRECPQDATRSALRADETVTLASTHNDNNGASDAL